MRKFVFIFTSLDCFPLYDIFLMATTSEVRTSRAFKKTKHKFINLVEEWFWLQSLKAILLGDAKVLTKYTAPKLPWPISLRSEKSFSGSSLKRDLRSRGPSDSPCEQRWACWEGAGPQPPVTIWVCDTTAPTDGSSARQWPHTDQHLTERESVALR